MMRRVRINKSMLWIIVLFISGGVYFFTACASSDSSLNNTVQPLEVDTNTSDQGVILRLLSSDGKEKIETQDSQFKDGTRILETMVYEWRFNTWNQISLGQSPYNPNDPVRVCGDRQSIILEVVDPNIDRVDLETKNGTTKLSIIKVNSRRFVAYKLNLENKEYHQVFGTSKDGEIMWQLFPEGYWIKKPGSWRK